MERDKKCERGRWGLIRLKASGGGWEKKLESMSVGQSDRVSGIVV